MKSWLSGRGAPERVSYGPAELLKRRTLAAEELGRRSRAVEHPEAEVIKALEQCVPDARKATHRGSPGRRQDKRNDPESHEDDQAQFQGDTAAVGSASRLSNERL